MALFSQIADEMALVDVRIKEVLEHHNRLVQEVADYLQRASGKRLRPALVLLAGQFGTLGASDERLIGVATAVELIHMATLVHDDIIDDAHIRRGLPAVRSKFTDPVAVLAGDFLFARAFQLFSETKNPAIVHTAAQVVYVMSTGEIVQHLDQGQVSSEAGYFRRIEAKTGFFLETSCRLGAIASGASEEVQDFLGQYGHHIGLAYQVIDDLLDWLADPKTLGKAVGEDLAMGIYTLPIIYGLNHPDYRQKLSGLVSQKTLPLDEIREVLIDCGAIDYCRTRAEQHLEAARDALLSLPQGMSREALMQVADFIGVRDH